MPYAVCAGGISLDFRPDSPCRAQRHQQQQQPSLLRMRHQVAEHSGGEWQYNSCCLHMVVAACQVVQVGTLFLQAYFAGSNARFVMLVCHVTPAMPVVSVCLSYACSQGASSTWSLSATTSTLPGAYTCQRYCPAGNLNACRVSVEHNNQCLHERAAALPDVCVGCDHVCLQALTIAVGSRHQQRCSHSHFRWLHLSVMWLVLISVGCSCLPGAISSTGGRLKQECWRGCRRAWCICGQHVWRHCQLQNAGKHAAQQSLFACGCNAVSVVGFLNPCFASFTTMAEYQRQDDPQ
jgi:hypothetical protein